MAPPVRNTKPHNSICFLHLIVNDIICYSCQPGFSLVGVKALTCLPIVSTLIYVCFHLLLEWLLILFVCVFDFVSILANFWDNSNQYCMVLATYNIYIKLWNYYPPSVRENWNTKFVLIRPLEIVHEWIEPRPTCIKLHYYMLYNTVLILTWVSLLSEKNG